jgi:lipoate-protein ligase A
MSETSWRLMVDGPAAGVWNMAVDEALLDGVGARTAPATLRFYRWSPACLSLGYFQALDVVDQVACRVMGVDIVRRPTGGRAILHDAELTYSITLPAAVLGHKAGILPSYHRISRALQAGLRTLGVLTTMAPESAAPTAAEHGAACFDRPSAHEILLDGKKLIGSAQVRRGSAILQHGSILVEPRIERLMACLRPAADGKREKADLTSSVAGLAEAGLRDTDAIAVAIAAAIGQEFAVELLPGTLMDSETALASLYVKDKYATPQWTEGPLARMPPNTTRTR